MDTDRTLAVRSSMLALVFSGHIGTALLLMLTPSGLGQGPAVRSDAVVWVTLIPDTATLTSPGQWSPNTVHVSIVSEAPSETEALTPEPGPVVHEPLSTQQPDIPATLAAKDSDPLGGVGFAMSPGPLPGAVLNAKEFQSLQDRLQRLAEPLSLTALMPATVSVQATQTGAITQVRLDQGTGSAELDALLIQCLEASGGLLLPQPGADRVLPGWYSLPPIELRSGSGIALQP